MYPRTINEVTEGETDVENYEENVHQDNSWDRPIDNLVESTHNEAEIQEEENSLPYKRDDIISRDNFYINKVINLAEIDKCKSRYIDGLVKVLRDKDMKYNYEIEFLIDTGASVSIINIGTWRIL